MKAKDLIILGEKEKKKRELEDTRFRKQEFKDAMNAFLESIKSRHLDGFTKKLSIRLVGCTFEMSEYTTEYILNEKFSSWFLYKIKEKKEDFAKEAARYGYCITFSNKDLYGKAFPTHERFKGCDIKPVNIIEYIKRYFGYCYQYKANVEIMTITFPLQEIECENEDSL